ncbi:Hypothetical predicted protein [Mytilus galloprovincialis]|uniref:NADP-dependent oxidoreductase domain-containing protein n=1 Tax=Mytilus galloprovincialis TaxID=29158 RepID=A0A8B6H7Q7_MYTGA|nr:Hypothetical predicted protein [Mytilus galloprovincialis]
MSTPSNFRQGTWVTFGGQITDEMAEEILTLAYESGINFFDTAEVYAAGKAEILLGKILKKKTWRRSSYIISTKLYWGGKAETEKGLSRKHIIEGLKCSLERLQLDYVDIVFANRPDSHTPMEEIVRAFTYVINQGWAMYWGSSRVGTITWSPLAGGILTGKYDDGVPIYSRAALKGYSWFKDKILGEEGRRQQARLREAAIIADRLGCSMSQLALAWVLKNENVQCVLLGASTVDQLYLNIQALQYVPKLSGSIMQELDKILGNSPKLKKESNMR